MSIEAIDLLGILFCLLSGWIGYRRGVVRSLISFAGLIASTILAYVFSPALGEWLIRGGILDTVLDLFHIETLTQSLMDTIIDQSGQMQSALAQILSITGGDLESIRVGIDQYIANTVAQMLAFFIIAFGISILCWGLQIVFERISKEKPMIGTVDHIAGGIIGLVLGICLVGIVFGGIAMIRVYSNGLISLPFGENSLFIGWITSLIMAFAH